MKRNPRKVKWTKANRMARGRDMTKDATFEFERKRNRPERYDRNLAENTLKAIKKIDKVRISREAKHHADRMKVKKPKDIRENRRVLEHDINLVKAPSSIQMDPSVRSWCLRNRTKILPWRSKFISEMHLPMIYVWPALYQASVYFLAFCICTHSIQCY